jgi:hypothetical protein
MIAGDGGRLAARRLAVAIGERESDAPARGDAGGACQHDEQRVEIGAVSLADLEAVRDVAEAEAGHALVVLHVIVDPS